MIEMIYEWYDWNDIEMLEMIVNEALNDAFDGTDNGCLEIIFVSCLYFISLILFAFSCICIEVFQVWFSVFIIY